MQELEIGSPTSIAVANNRNKKEEEKGLVENLGNMYNKQPGCICVDGGMWQASLECKG